MVLKLSFFYKYYNLKCAVSKSKLINSCCVSCRSASALGLSVEKVFNKFSWAFQPLRLKIAIHDAKKPLVVKSRRKSAREG